MGCGIMDLVHLDAWPRVLGWRIFCYMMLDDFYTMFILCLYDVHTIVTRLLYDVCMMLYVCYMCFMIVI